MNDKLDILSQIKSVEVPHFLLTRISQKIKNERISQFSPRMTWALSACVFLIMSLNFVVFFQNKGTSSKSNLAQTMQLLPQNDFYK